MADIQSNISVNIDTSNALTSLKALQGQISAFHQQMAKSGALAASETSKMQSSLMNGINRSGQFDARLKTIKTTTESFTEALEKNKMSMGQYFKYAGAATKDFGRLFKGEFDTIEKVARERVKDLQTQYIKMGRDANGAMKAISIRPLVLDLNDASTKMQIAAQKQQVLNQLLKQGSTQMLNWGKNTQWAGRQLMVGFTVPLTMLGQIAAKTFMQMEEAVIKFQRVYGDFSTTTQQTKEMTTEITNLAKAYTKYGVAVSDTMSMAADAAAMGKVGEELKAQVQSATELAVLGGVDQKQALETTISLTNAFGISADQLRSKINFLNVVENQTVTSIEDLTVAIPKAAPVIKQLGGDVEDLAFFLTAMKEGGINASEGANALKSGIASIINPTKKASDMLNGFGVNIKGIVTANKGDVKGMIMGVAESLNALDPLKRAQAIEQLFGKFQFARISTLFQNITDVNSQASKVAALAAQGPEASAILAQRELQKIEDSPMFKFKKALEDLKTELVPLGEQFLKMVTPIAEFVKKALEGFNNLSAGTKDFVGNIALWLGGVGPIVIMTVGLIANGIANMIKIFATFKGFLNGVGKGTQDLGSQTAYMTTQQIEAAAVASSLDQIHSKLRQTFTSEASAVANLTTQLEKATAAQKAYGWMPTTGVPGKVGRKKFANGGMVRGPGGPKDDMVPTDLSNGEAVIDAETVKKNPRIIGALFAGQKIQIPGYATNNSKVFNFERYDSVFPGLSDLLKTTTQSMGGILGDILKLANTTHEIAGASAGASSITGANAAHGNARKILSVEEARAAGSELEGLGASGRTVRKLKGATKFGTEDISAFSNLTFPMPRSANLGAISGTDLSSWVSQDPKRFMSMISKNASMDPNDPGLKEFADRVASKMGIAGAKAITESDFEKIVAQSIEQQTEGAAKQALVNARDTYQTFNVTDSPDKRAKREFAPKGFGISATGQAVAGTGTSAYGRVRQAMANSGEWKQIDQQSNSFVKNVISRLVAGVRESTRQASPSKEAHDAGKNIGVGAIQGIKEGSKDAKAAGTAIAKAVTSQAQKDALKIASATKAAYRNDPTLNNLAIQKRQAEMMKADTALIEKEIVARRKVVAAEIKNAQAIDIAAMAAQEEAASRGFEGSAPLPAGYQGPIGPNDVRKKPSLLSRMGNSKIGQKVASAGKSFVGGGIGAGMGVGMAGMAIGMIPGMEGVGSAISMASIIPSILPMLMNPIGATVAALGALTLGIIALNNINEENKKKQIALGNASVMSTDSLIKMSKALGTVSASEARREKQAKAFGITAEDTTGATSFLESDAGKQLITDMQTQKTSGMSNEQIAQSVSTNLANAVVQGVMSEGMAKAVMMAAAQQTGNASLTGSVSGLSDLVKGGPGAIGAQTLSGLKADYAVASGDREVQTNGTGDKETVANDMGKLRTNAVATANAFSQIVGGQDVIAQQFDTGAISLEEYNTKMEELRTQQNQALELAKQQRQEMGGEYDETFKKNVEATYTKDSEQYKTAEALSQFSGNEDFKTNLQLNLQSGNMSVDQINALLEMGKNKNFATNYALNVQTYGQSDTDRAMTQMLASGMTQKEIELVFSSQDRSGNIIKALDKIEELAKGKKGIKMKALIDYNPGLFSKFKKDADLFDALPEEQRKSMVTDFVVLSEKIDMQYSNVTGNAEIDKSIAEAKKAAEWHNMLQEAIGANKTTTTGGNTGGDGGGSSAPTKSDKANAALSILGSKEEKINKAYDKRLKALDEIQKANDKINEQQKDQLDLADALSKGDIGAAARAQQQARANAQSSMMDQQRQQMESARDAQIASLRVNGMSRVQLEAFLAKQQGEEDKKTLGSWQLSTGGMVPKTQYFSIGGQPRGTDTIAAMLTPGEFVVKKSAVDKLGTGTMKKINNGELPKSGSVYNYSINVNVKSDADAEQIAKVVMTKIENVKNQGMKGDKA